MVHDALNLLNGRVAALFLMDGGRMTQLNEPWEPGKPAPKAFLGVTLDGRKAAWFRNDVADEVRERVISLVQDERAEALVGGAPAQHAQAYLAALGGAKITSELCYCVERDVPNRGDALVPIDGGNAASLCGAGFDWLTAEVGDEQPCIATVRDGVIASLCRSVRHSGAIHEAGIETLPAHRGQGLALDVLGGWARAVWELGGIALYSHHAHNAASRRVAEKAGLRLYGACIEIE